MRYSVENKSRYHRRFENEQWVRPNEKKIVELKRPLTPIMIQKWRRAGLHIREERSDV